MRTSVMVAMAILYFFLSTALAGLGFGIGVLALAGFAYVRGIADAEKAHGQWLLHAKLWEKKNA